MTGYILAAVLISAIVTYALRGIVFVFFNGKSKMPKWLEQLGNVLPAAVMGVLVIYCLRNIRNDMIHTGIPGIIAAVITGIMHRWKHNTFLSIIVGTVVYMVLIRTIF